jgi:KDO2-lipid IV(A) lauroyltransferase
MSETTARVLGRQDHTALFAERRLSRPYSGFIEKVQYFGFLVACGVLGLFPLSWIYRLSDLLWLIVFRVFGYRRKVIRSNLAQAFPEWSADQREEVAVRHERYFVDLLLETFVLLRLSPAELEKRVEIRGLDQLRELAREGKNFLFVMGHFGNWEWGGAQMSRLLVHQQFAIYHPLSNRGFDRLLYAIRRRHLNRLIPMKVTFQKMRAFNRVRSWGKLLYNVCFIADQAARPENACWTRFLGRETAVFWGTERTAREFGFPVFYLSAQRPRRGHYIATIEKLCDEPRATPEGAITVRFTRRLEADVRREPEIWLWTHRRWKHSRPAGLTLYDESGV